MCSIIEWMAIKRIWKCQVNYSSRRWTRWHTITHFDPHLPRPALLPILSVSSNYLRRSLEVQSKKLGQWTINKNDSQWNLPSGLFSDNTFCVLRFAAIARTWIWILDKAKFPSLDLVLWQQIPFTKGILDAFTCCIHQLLIYEQTPRYKTGHFGVSKCCSSKPRTNKPQMIFDRNHCRWLTPRLFYFQFKCYKDNRLRTAHLRTANPLLCWGNTAVPASGPGKVFKP